uniref:Fork-head domain-containing protein n=1 Tax=Panagrellus redivivus TaxID=6233 RepID=A0A7E4W5M7_PANRE
MAEECELPTLRWFLTNAKSNKERETKDYSNSPEKPPHKYSQIIADAFVANDHAKLSLSQIYGYFTSKYGFFRLPHRSWKNSVRHLLSLDSRFIKVPRNANKRGKGALWMLDRSAVYADGTLKPAAKNVKRSNSRRMPTSRIRRESSLCSTDKPHLNPVVERYLAKMHKLRQRNDFSNCSSPMTEYGTNTSIDNGEYAEYYGEIEVSDASFLEDFGLSVDDFDTVGGRFSPDILDEFLSETFIEDEYPEDS